MIATMEIGTKSSIMKIFRLVGELKKSAIRRSVTSGMRRVCGNSGHLMTGDGLISAWIRGRLMIPRPLVAGLPTAVAVKNS